MGDWLDEGGSGDPVDVGALFDSKAADLLYEVVATGALISIGLTSDRGALGVTVTVDGRWRREYFREGESLTSWLGDGLPSIQAAAEAARSVRASSGPRRRTRGL